MTGWFKLTAQNVSSIQVSHVHAVLWRQTLKSSNRVEETEDLIRPPSPDFRVSLNALSKCISGIENPNIIFCTVCLHLRLVRALQIVGVS